MGSSPSWAEFCFSVANVFQMEKWCLAQMRCQAEEEGRRATPTRWRQAKIDIQAWAGKKSKRNPKHFRKKPKKSGRKRKIFGGNPKFICQVGGTPGNQTAGSEDWHRRFPRGQNSVHIITKSSNTTLFKCELIWIFRVFTIHWIGQWAGTPTWY